MISNVLFIKNPVIFICFQTGRYASPPHNILGVFNDPDSKPAPSPAPSQPAHHGNGTYQPGLSQTYSRVQSPPVIPPPFVISPQRLPPPPPLILLHGGTHPVIRRVTPVEVEIVLECDYTYLIPGYGTCRFTFRDLQTVQLSGTQ